MENIKLIALKELYKTELKKLELMKEYIAEKESVRYSLAVEILREVKKDKDAEGIDFDMIEMSQLAEDKRDDFFRRDEDMMNVDFTGSLEYDLQKAFVVKIEERLKQEFSVVPVKDLQGNVVFEEMKK
jgi:predicted N-acyltransferase